MKLIVLLLLCSCATTLCAERPTTALYANDFENAQPGTVPEGFMIMSGSFVVKEQDGNRFLELPGAPLDTYGLLFGPAEPLTLSAGARFYGTKQGRKFPTFAVSVSGVGGYRLQVSPGKKSLEIYKGDEAKAAVPLEWQPGEWTSLRVQLRKAKSGWLIEGKAWLSGGPEPANWTITLEEAQDPPPGRPGIWGSPYSGTPILFDDLIVAPAVLEKK